MVTVRRCKQDDNSVDNGVDNDTDISGNDSSGSA